MKHGSIITLQNQKSWVWSGKEIMKAAQWRLKPAFQPKKFWWWFFLLSRCFTHWFSLWLTYGQCGLLLPAVRVDKSHLLAQKMEEMHWETINHPLYSPDLFPMTIFCLCSWKKLMEGNDSKIMMMSKSVCTIGWWCALNLFLNKKYLSFQIVGKSVLSLKEVMWRETKDFTC